MNVYCVITETDQGIDLSGVYWNLESAVEHVKNVGFIQCFKNASMMDAK